MIDITLIFLIFFARILDVSIGTLRVIFISKGLKYLAPILGFFEVLIWVVVVSKLMTDVTNPILYVAYAAGFSAGTFIGMKLEEKLSIGKVMIRIITQMNAEKLIEELEKFDFPITISDARGRKGKVKIIFSVIDKKELKEILKIVKHFNPNAFYSIEDVRYARSLDIFNKRKRFLGFYRKFK